MLNSLKQAAAGVAALAAVGAGSAAIASAATSSTTSTPSGSSSPPAQAAFPAHGTAAHEDAEKAVTGDAAAKAQAAAVKSVGSGTAGSVTSDYTGKGYEVTVTKTDGTTAEVHLDSSLNVMQGHRGGGPGHPGGPPPSPAG